MPRIKTDSLQPGMIVTRAVQNLDNMLLLPAGATLSERQIGILQAWGVTEVEVAAAEGQPGAAGAWEDLAPEIMAGLTAEVRSRFWQLDESSPVQMEILRLALQRQARKPQPGPAA